MLANSTYSSICAAAHGGYFLRFGAQLVERIVCIGLVIVCAGKATGVFLLDVILVMLAQCTWRHQCCFVFWFAVLVCGL